MSKVDAQRAMREANYARRHAGDAARRATATPKQEPVVPAARPTRTTPVAAAEVVSTAAVEVERCGHQSMNGRSCTREAAHPEKSHRYS